MIKDIERQIRERLGEKYNLSADKGLSFLKYNTSISGTGRGCKVLFFVFVGDQKDPQFIVKTVRVYRDCKVIRDGYVHLKRLNGLTINSRFYNMFPEALLVHDDGNEIWNMETACIGNRPDLKVHFQYILSEFFSFSGHILKQNKNKIILDVDYGKKLINEFQGPKEALKKLVTYLERLWTDKVVELPEILQHGDFTIDNILISGGDIKIIDCDTFGNIKIPGFDVFHFLLRNSTQGKEEWLKRYFRYMKIDYMPDKKLFFLYFLNELYIKKDYVLIDIDASSIIEKFENMIVSYLR